MNNLNEKNKEERRGNDLRTIEEENFVEFYVSMDVEATGPFPGEYSMSSMGAFVAGARRKDGSYVSFGKDSEIFGNSQLSQVFYGEMKPISDKYIPEAINVGILEGFDKSIPDADGSRHFAWMKEHGKEPEIVMSEFNEFVNLWKNKLNARPVFMGYPAGFDWMFVYYYLMRFTGESPFGFSAVIDMKTYFSAKFGKPLVRSTKRNMPKRLFPDLPHTHRADDDAIEQGIMGMNMLLD